MFTALRVLSHLYIEVYHDLTHVRHSGQHFATLTELVNGDAPVLNKWSECGDSIRQPFRCCETCEGEKISATAPGQYICKGPLIRCSSSEAGSFLGNFVGSLVTMCGCGFLITRLVPHSCIHTLSYPVCESLVEIPQSAALGVIACFPCDDRLISTCACVCACVFVWGRYCEILRARVCVYVRGYM